MRILIVDDDPRRYQRLSPALEGAGISRDQLSIVTSAMDAREQLRSHKYDLLVTDILLPLRPEGNPEERHSLELLTELLEFGDLNKPRQIIGLSGYNDSAQKLAPFFRQNLWTVVSYSESSDEWIAQIVNSVKYMLAEATSKDKKEFKTDVAIVCALLEPELKSILSLPWDWSAASPIDDVTFCHQGKFQSKGASYSVTAACASRMGMVSSALLSAKLINHFRPRLLVMSGICAGIKGKANLGDAVLIDPSWDWQSGKRESDEQNNSIFKMAPHHIPISETVRSRFEQLRMDKKALTTITAEWPGDAPGILKIVPGPVASGSAVLADSDVLADIRKQHRELCGVEMEAYGVYSAAANSCSPRPLAFAVKSVCDYADSEKDDRYQNYASFTSAAVVRLFLERYFHELEF